MNDIFSSWESRVKAQKERFLEEFKPQLKPGAEQALNGSIVRYKTICVDPPYYNAGAMFFGLYKDQEGNITHIGISEPDTELIRNQLESGNITINGMRDLFTISSRYRLNEIYDKNKICCHSNANLPFNSFAEYPTFEIVDSRERVNYKMYFNSLKPKMKHSQKKPPIEIRNEPNNRVMWISSTFLNRWDFLLIDSHTGVELLSFKTKRNFITSIKESLSEKAYKHPQITINHNLNLPQSIALLLGFFKVFIKSE